MEKPHSDLDWIEKLLIAAGLVTLSTFLYVAHYFLFDSAHGPAYYADKVFSHIAFLPIHALVLGVIIDGMITFRERQGRKRRLNMFLGIFFRQLGADILAMASGLCQNRDELDAITVVHQQWGARDFRRARQGLAAFRPRMAADEKQVLALLDYLRQREGDILEMTRNPLVLEFEDLYHGLISLFHLIEEIHYRNSDQAFSPGELTHLAKDVGKSLKQLSHLWLIYLEHLKAEHPVLFHCQVGVCSTIGTMLLEDRYDE
ncbi:hypothetical protein [Desulfarculus baarsii]